jgi:N-succinyldiaminopimelate aminotransferase
MSGATGGLSVVCETVLEPGDEVLLPAPYWPLIRGCIASRSATPVEIPFFDRIGSSDFDPERALEEQITDRTAAVYVNTPHNPTGRALPRDVVDVVARVALRHNLWILCDETYEELWYGDGPYEPVWGRFDVQPNAIAVHTMSKAYGLAGARVGWAHGPEEVVQKLRGVQTFQTYCAPRPMQFGAARTLREGDRWLAEARRLYRHSGNAAADALGIPHPEGGTFLMFDASPYLRPEDETCMPFLERCLEAGVMLTPGGSCGGDYARWARLCFTSVPPEDLQEALRRLRTVLDGSA